MREKQSAPYIIAVSYTHLDVYKRQYLHWDQLAHAENWLLFEKNIGAYVCIDEVALSRGELYTCLLYTSYIFTGTPVAIFPFSS